MLGLVADPRSRTASTKRLHRVHHNPLRLTPPPKTHRTRSSAAAQLSLAAWSGPTCPTCTVAHPRPTPPPRVPVRSRPVARPLHVSGALNACGGPMAHSPPCRPPGARHPTPLAHRVAVATKAYNCHECCDAAPLKQSWLRKLIIT
jgi:hypothetical protein